MNEEKRISLSTRIAITAILLAVCIASQFLKELSVYITGPIINLCIILTVMTAGVVWGSILGVITPISAFIIAPSPVMTMIPAIIPFIIIGNVILAVMAGFLFKPAIFDNKSLVNPRALLMAVLSALAKGCFMGLTISLWLLPSFIPQGSPLVEKMPVFKMTFSVTQFVTALIGFVYFFIIWKPVCKIFENSN